MVADVGSSASLSLGWADDDGPPWQPDLCVHGAAGNESLGDW